MPTDPTAVVARVVGEIERRHRQTARVLVAIDGPDAAGKTTFAGRLAAALPGHVVRATADDFQHPRAVRARRGRLSAAGYYLDAFDHETLTARLLAPFRSGADQVTVSAWDYRRDEAAERSADVLARAVPVVDDVQRYLPGQELYRDDVDPEARADILIDNTDPTGPVFLRPSQWRSNG